MSLNFSEISFCKEVLSLVLYFFSNSPSSSLFFLLNSLIKFKCFSLKSLSLFCKSASKIAFISFSLDLILFERASFVSFKKLVKLVSTRTPTSESTFPIILFFFPIFSTFSPTFLISLLILGNLSLKSCISSCISFVSDFFLFFGLYFPLIFSLRCLIFFSIVGISDTFFNLDFISLASSINPRVSKEFSSSSSSFNL